jgi:solute carrier family 50 protein (sugar transporter)
MAAFYASPLTTLATVLSTRDASSLHLPLCATNALNGSLWFAYGLVGVIAGVLQQVLPSMKNRIAHQNSRTRTAVRVSLLPVALLPAVH